MTIDERITKVEVRLRDARKRNDSRAIHAAQIELQDLVHRRMRRDKRAGLFRLAGDAAQLIAIVGAGVALYVLLNPLPAFAADGPTGPTGFEVAAGWALLAMIVAIGVSALLNARGEGHRGDE